MSIIGDAFSVAGAIAGKKAAKKKNKLAKEQYAEQQKLTDKQVASADWITQIAKQLAAQGTGTTDPYGGGTSYDPVTGTWSSSLSAPQAAVQDASYAEELARNTNDQNIRRQGVQSSENARGAAAGQAAATLGDINAFKSGVGAVDAGKLATTLRTNRTAAVNAGYDDAARAANTISLRSGASAGDALSRIARSRAQSIATTMGDPELEALQAADTSNNQRFNNNLNAYNIFDTKGRQFIDTAFNPSSYAKDAVDNTFKTQALDLQTKDAAIGGASNAGALVGSGAAGLRQAAGIQNANTNYNGTADMLRGFGNAADSILGDDKVKALLSKIGI